MDAKKALLTFESSFYMIDIAKSCMSGKRNSFDVKDSNGNPLFKVCLNIDVNQPVSIGGNIMNNSTGSQLLFYATGLGINADEFKSLVIQFHVNRDLKHLKKGNQLEIDMTNKHPLVVNAEYDRDVEPMLDIVMDGQSFRQAFIVNLWLPAKKQEPEEKGRKKRVKKN